MALTTAAAAPRRVLATRDAGWARALARTLGRLGVRPNAVSMTSVAFACAAAAAFSAAPAIGRGGQVGLLLAAGACIQLRLLCNLLDGMLAVEEGLGGKLGAIYNDLPDRVADVLILVGAGYAARDLAIGVPLGWAAAVVALMTAYVRVLAGSLGLTERFIGPMAKQHRMFTLTVAAIAAAMEAFAGLSPRAIAIALAAIVAGSILTVARRTTRMAAEAAAR